MECRQCLPLSVVQLKGKHYRKPHCRNGVVDTLGLRPCLLNRAHQRIFFQRLWFHPHINLSKIFLNSFLSLTQCDVGTAENGLFKDCIRQLAECRTTEHKLTFCRFKFPAISQLSKTRGMCYSHFANGVSNGVIVITQWSFLIDYYVSNPIC